MVSLPLLCTSCCRFWLFFSASACFSAGSPLSSSLGFGSRVVLYSGGFSWVVLASGSSAFLPFSLPPVLHFCRVPSPYPLGSAASTSAPVLSGVQCPASRSASGLLALSLSLSLRLFPRSPYLSLLFVPLPLLHLSLLPFGFCFCGSFRSSLVTSAASVAVSSDPQVRVAPFVLPLSSCVVLLFALFSRLLAFCSLLLLLVRTLCGASRSGVSSPFFSLDWFERDSLFPLRFSFLFASLLRVASWSFSFRCSIFCCFCAFTGFCLSCPPLFAGFVRLTSASLSLLLGRLFHGPALVGSYSRALSESLSPARWLLSSYLGFLQLPALLLLPIRCFFLVACSCRFSLLLSLFLVGLPCWQLFWFMFLAVCSVYGSSFLVCRSALLFSVVCRLVWLGPPPSLASPSYLESCSFAGFPFSFSSSLLGLRLSSGSSAGVRFGSSSFFSSGARFW